MSHAAISALRPTHLRWLATSVFVLALVLLGAAAASAQPFGAAWEQFPGQPTSGYVTIPHSIELNPTSAFTIEAWVGISNSTTGEDCRSIAGKNYLAAWWIGQCTVGGQPTLRSYLKGGGSAKNGGIIPRGPMTHVAVVFDGSTRKHYINGELAATFAESGPLTSSTSPVRIGSDVSWEHTPTGIIDEVRIWNVARSQDQIRTWINKHIAAAQPGLVAVWDFPSLTDPIGGHNGSLFNFPAGVFPFSAPVAITCGSSTVNALCLQGRYSITTKWRTNPTPGTPTDGNGSVVVAGLNSGIFWFFSSDNWEVMVKALNACGLNSRYWIFSAATTNVFYRMDVTDVKSGQTKIYFNYPGPPAPAVTDTDAFATCP
jgi:hypothetical protein